MELSKLDRLNNNIADIESNLANENYATVFLLLTSLLYNFDESGMKEREQILQFTEKFTDFLHRDPQKKISKKSTEGKKQFKKELKELFQEISNHKQFKVLRKIKEAKEQHANSLDLEGMGLNTIPQEINQLTHLLALNLRDNHIEKIENIDRLTKLSALDLGKNQIVKIEGLDTLTKLSKLYLHECQIKKIEHLENLVELVTLDLSGNARLKKIEGLEKLRNVRTLRLDRCSIKVIENLEKLSTLTHLSIGKNSEIAEIQGLDKLKRLQTLILDGCSIREIENLDTLVELSELTLTANPIRNINGLDKLKNLRRLQLQSCYLTSMEGVGELENLEDLDVSRNEEIRKIEHLEKIENLKILRVAHCNISKIENLNKLSHLTTLDLSFNKISQLEKLEKLRQLEGLFIEGNKIDAITLNEKEHQAYFFNFLESKPASFFLRIGNNPFIREIDGLNQSDYNSLFTFDPNGSVYDSNHLPIILKDKSVILKKENLVEITLPHKLVLIGNSNSGKSSLVDFLLENELQTTTPRTSTEILEIRHWKPRNKPHFFVYDFGGQDFYHATYQMFFSKEATYLLLWSKDNNYNHINQENTEERRENYHCFDVNYWLGNIHYLNNPLQLSNVEEEAWCKHLVLIENKIDLKFESIEESYPLDMDKNFGEYEQHKVSMLNREDKLIQSRRAWLKTYLQQLHPHKAKELPYRKKAIDEYFRKWERLKEQNEWTYETLKVHLQTNYKYWQQLEEDDIQRLFKRFTAGGLMLWYFSDESLSDRIWIDPSSLQSEILSLLNKLDSPTYSIIRQEKGTVDVSELKHDEHFKKLKDILIKNQIIFEDISEGKYIIPQKLPVDLKTNRLYKLAIQGLKKAFTLKFKYFMPLGIMNRLICSFGKLSENKFYGRYEMVFSYNNRKVQLKCSLENLTIEVKMNSENREDWKEIFRIILLAYHRLEYQINTTENAEIEGTSSREINSTAFLKFEKLAPSDLQISVGTGEYYLTYADLQKDFKNKLNKVKVTNKDGAARNVPAFNFNPFLDESFNLPKKVFISYAHTDIAFKRELQKYLINLERTNRIEIWQDGMIQPGTNWDKKIRRHLENADIVILLVSQDFIASNYIHTVELRKTFLQMQKGKTKIFPVMVKMCNLRNWKALPENVLVELQKEERENYVIDNYQFLPQYEKQRLHAVNQWLYPENAWVQISEKLEELL